METIGANHDCGGFRRRARLPRRIAGAATVAATLAFGACGWRTRLDSVLLITLDTMRADHVSCYGPSPVATPNIDQIAEHGAIVERAWSPIPLTTPAHASILSGLYPPAHGMRNNARFRLPDDVTTLAEITHDRGAATAAIVASFTTLRVFGLDRGFDSYDDALGHAPDGRPRNERPGNEVADRAIAWLEGHADRPFFLWAHLYDPHDPYEAPPAFADKYPGDPYSGEVAFVDVQVGRILQALQKSGASGRTVVVVVGDHGEGLLSHGEPEHGFLLYEEALHVPFLIAAPGKVAPGTRVSEVASLVDVAPTVLGLLGIPAPSGIQGIDLFGEQPRKEPGAYAETLYPFEEFGWSAVYAFRSGDLKVIEAPRIEMYDLKADPGEVDDLSSSRAEDAARMIADLRRTASGLIDTARLARAVGLAEEGAVDPEHLERLASLGYVGGGGGVEPQESEGLPDVGGRNPRDAMDDLRLYKEAERLLIRGEPEKAAPLFEALRRSDPGNPQVLLKLAQAKQRQNLDAEAEAHFRELEREHPTFYLGIWAYCNFLLDAGRPLEARDQWIQLARLVPGYVWIEVGIARAETAAGLPDEASARLETYLAKHANDSRAWRELGRARRERKDPSGALEAYRKALDLQPTDAETVEEALALLATAGKRREAADLVQELITRAPDDPFLLRKKTDLQPPR